ncbi:hypothetical protein Tco_0982063 [Tanacetum coccineum]
MEIDEWRAIRQALNTCLTQQHKLDSLRNLREKVVQGMLEFLPVKTLMEVDGKFNIADIFPVLKPLEHRESKLPRFSDMLDSLLDYSQDNETYFCANSAGPEVDSLVRSTAPIMTEAITVATTVAIPADISKDKSAPHPSVFGSSSSSEKTDRTLSLFTGKSGSGFDAGSIRAEESVGADSEEIYVPEWTVTKGFEMNDGHLCANMIDHFTPPAFFKTVRGMEHEQLFTEFNVSTARNLSLSSEVRMRAEYNILEKRKWRTLAEEKNTLLEAKDKEIEDLKSQLLRAREESAEVTQLRAQVSGLEATENSLRGEVASAKDRNTLLEQECDSLKLKVTGLESAIVDKDHKLSELGASSSSLKSQNQSLVDLGLAFPIRNKVKL